MLDRLEAKSLIERAGMPGDRRYTLVRLTQKGEAVFRTVFTAHIRHLTPFFERALTLQDATQLTELLRRLRDSFRRGGVPKSERG